MKIQVRNSVFETNSSSMHSIAIIKPENFKSTMDDYYGWQLTSTWLKPGADVETNEPILLNDDSLDFGRWPFRSSGSAERRRRTATTGSGPRRAASSSCRSELRVVAHVVRLPFRSSG